ncbi:MAG TPA: 23S rRNA (pseudouridine(1915)-N(3))-methyltransferase RlmH [Hyphomicrobiaceae bacterium]|nr:23S rRNA (pseudouridine(1915)-N(3))-methyltransferase RlmH [Hyphomicrobiaceae bacterium]
MRLLLVAIGRLKDGPERALFERYWTRLAAMSRPLGITAIGFKELAESPARDATTRKADEGRRLIETAAGLVTIVLDERGKAMSSEAFASRLQSMAGSGGSGLAILVGGPDGHSPEVLAGARLKLSFGAMTFPHGLARILIAEQLYRAATIAAGHPYHRS